MTLSESNPTLHTIPYVLHQPRACALKYFKLIQLLNLIVPLSQIVTSDKLGMASHALEFVFISTDHVTSTHCRGGFVYICFFACACRPEKK